MKHSNSPGGVSNSMVNPSKLMPASAPVAAKLCQDSLAKLATSPVPVVAAGVSGPIEGPSPAESIPEETRMAVAAVTIAEADAMMLTQPQREAIIQLTSGATRSAAAAAAGVTRTTLYRWLNHDPNFKAAYNAWHKDVITTAQAQLLAASHEAIGCVLTAIRRGDAHLAWKLLASMGLTNPGKPGSTDVAHLQRQAELDLKRADIAQRKEVNDIWMDDLLTLDPPTSPL